MFMCEAIQKHSSRCTKCHIKKINSKPKKTKISWPSKQELQSIVEELGYCETARKLGVSDNAVRKHLR